MNKAARYITSGAAFVAFVAAQAAGGQSATPAPVVAPGAAGVYAQVAVDGRPLFNLLGIAGLPAAARADRVNARIASLIRQRAPLPQFTAADIRDTGAETQILLAGQPILSVTDADAQDAVTSRRELALLWGGKMATAIADARAARANPLRGAGIVIVNTASDMWTSTLQWLPRLAGALILLVLFWIAARLARGVVSLGLARSRVDVNMRQLVRAVAFYGTWLVGGVAVLSTLGIQSTGIAATLGVSGFVFGFAFKDVLSHFLAGLMLLSGRQFHIGDQIVVGAYEGTVERIELRALYLRTYDNRLVIIPNGDVFTSAVTSNTASPYRRRDLIVGVAYQNDLQRAQGIALDAVSETPGVLDDPRPDVLVDELGANGVNLRVRFYANSTRADYLHVGSACMLNVKAAFDRANIAMAANTPTVVVASAAPTAAASSGAVAAAGKDP